MNAISLKNSITKEFKFLVILFCFLSINRIEAEKIVFTPQWTPQAQFIGYYVALEKGFYKELGLDVDIEHPSSSNPAISKLEHQESDIVSLQLVQAMMLKDKGENIILLSQMGQHSNVLIVANKNITSIEQLNHKRIACWKDGYIEAAVSLFKDKGYEIEWIPFNNSVTPLISEAVDASLAMRYNEYFQLKNTGLRLSDKNVFSICDLGYDIPEDGLYCLESVYDKKKKEIDYFIEASEKGWEYAREHREESLQILKKIMAKNHSPYNHAHQQWMLDNFLQSQLNEEGVPCFDLSPTLYENSIQILLHSGVIKNYIPYHKFKKEK